jgi:hypothetical protein
MLINEFICHPRSAPLHTFLLYDLVKVVAAAAAAAAAAVCPAYASSAIASSAANEKSSATISRQNKQETYLRGDSVRVRLHVRQVCAFPCQTREKNNN